MNSQVLFAVLIFSSVSTASSFLDFSDFSFSDEESSQSDNLKNEVAFLSIAEDSKEYSEADQPNLKELVEDEGRKGNFTEDLNSFGESVNNSMNHSSAEEPKFIEETAKKNSENFFHIVDHSNNQEGRNRILKAEETKPSQAQRREVKKWKSKSDYPNVYTKPWSLDLYPKTNQNDYSRGYSSSNYEGQNRPSFIVAQNYPDNNEQRNKEIAQPPPQYYQKNYYYNYYPPLNEREQVKWGDKTISEEIRRKPESGKKGRTRNPCRMYLDFLKYAFDKLEGENEDQSSEEDSDYDDEDYGWHQAYATNLHGPTLYIDNSGKVSQVSTNGHGIQVVDGISPMSIISISTSPTTPIKPKTSTEREEPKTTTPATRWSFPKWNFDTTGPYFGDDNQSLPTTKSEEEISTTPSEIVETTTFEDKITTVFDEELMGKLGEGDRRKFNTSEDDLVTFRESTFITPPPSQNEVKVKTILSVENEKHDENCKDKMLPCPDTFNITYPLNGYCNRYVSCESGRAIRRTCPQGLHFNLIIKSCDLPHNSFCTYTCPRPDGIFGIPGDCGGYFICKNSEIEYRMCPPRMHWDAKRSTCIFSELSTCPMKCYNDNEVKHYEGDCKAYIVCLNGIPYYHKCPPNTKFNKTNLVCEPEKLSKCQDDPRLLTKILNPSVLCKNVQLQMNTSSWCRAFLDI